MRLKKVTHYKSIHVFIFVNVDDLVSSQSMLRVAILNVLPLFE